MTYCNKITSNKIYKMNETELNQTLNTCEACSKYHQCDTVALMNNELQLKQGEILKCPHCEHYQEFCDCPDLFYSDANNSKDINNQLKNNSVQIEVE